MKRLGLWFIAATLVACGGSPKKIGKPVVWPPPPDKGRIQFVTAFAHSNDLDRSAWTGFKKTVFGGTDDPAIHQPMGLAISDDGKRLYIADMGLGRVLVADFKQKRIKLFAPDLPFSRPFDVAIDDDENVYVTDMGKAEVVKVDQSGERVFAVTKGLERPTGIAVDRERKLMYVADTASLQSKNHRVRVYNLDGEHLRDLGPPEGGETRGEGDGQVYFPIYLALDAEGNVYVGDSMNFRVQQFDPEGNFVRKMGTHGDGPGTFARLKGLDFDSFGNLYVVDGGHAQVELYNREFQALMAFGGDVAKVEFFTGPRAIAIHRPTNRIYVSNVFSARINVYDLINTTAEDSVPVDPDKLTADGDESPAQDPEEAPAEEAPAEEAPAEEPPAEESAPEEPAAEQPAEPESAIEGESEPSE